MRNCVSSRWYHEHSEVSDNPSEQSVDERSGCCSSQQHKVWRKPEFVHWPPHFQFNNTLAAVWYRPFVSLVPRSTTCDQFDLEQPGP